MVIDVSWDIVELDAALIVDSALHLGHSLLSFFLRLVLDKQVAWVCADILLILFHEPVVHYLSELREPFNQVLLILLPLLLLELGGHVGCNCIYHPNQSGVGVDSNLECVHGKVGLFVLKDIYGCEGGGLSLGSCLRLRDHVISVAAVAEANDAADVALEEFYLLQLADAAGLFD